MRIVLDTNVFISGVFFTGPPYQILKAWRDGQVQILVSLEILEEYSRVGSNLASRFKGVDLEPFLELMAIHSEMIIPLPSLQLSKKILLMISFCNAPSQVMLPPL